MNPGSHFMANSKCQLPTGSFRVQKKAWTRMKCGSLAHFFIVLRGRRILECCAQGYEEVHVKPFKHPDVNPEDLIPLSDAWRLWRLWRLLLCEARDELQNFDAFCCTNSEVQIAHLVPRGLPRCHQAQHGAE